MTVLQVQSLPVLANQHRHIFSSLFVLCSCSMLTYMSTVGVIGTALGKE
jgi:hypothetical protein